LQPIIARAFMIEPMNRARLEVRAARGITDIDGRLAKLAPHTIDLMQRGTDITSDRLTLGVVLGPGARLVDRLAEIAETFAEAGKSVTAWAEGSLADEAFEPQLDEIVDRRNKAVGVLLVSAYETVGWEQPTDLVSAMLPTNT
jgi:hypothetical protein